MDYAKLKSAALAGAEDEEAVTVDTRALIDKVLARYSGEWTTLRELIQNAADAQASTVSIRWETLPSATVPAPPPPSSSSDLLKHVLVNHTIRRLVVRNDGLPFAKSDWARIKRIAEGNPDETKIGAFGVGFYSVFADCEEPFISSGDEAMAFYWKGNALFTKKSRLPEGQASRDTAFVLDYRNATMALPNLMSVCQFLATSLTFVALQRIEFFVDDWRIMALEKTAAPARPVSIPRHLDCRTAQKLMEVTTVDRTSVRIDATFISAVGWKRPQPATVAPSDGSGAAERPSLRSFFRRLQSAAASQPVLRTKAQNEEAALQERIAADVTEPCGSNISLRVASASVATTVARDFAVELERATKKPPPRTTKLSILTASYDEASDGSSSSPPPSSSQNPIEKSVDVFASVLPNKKPGGRVFIGFPTMQTTGAGMHISAPSVIPTVEREAIDLNARYVRLWNIELLRAAGIMARLAYAQEMEELRTKMAASLKPGEKISPAAVARFMPEAAHILATYAFCDSTPSAQVGQLIEEAFWTCSNHADIETYSSRGVLPTTRVRTNFDELGQFVGDIPVVPPELKELLFVRKLCDFGLITGVTNADIEKELQGKAMSKDQAVAFIKWLGKKTLAGEIQRADAQPLIDAAVCTMEEASAGSQATSGGVVLLSAAQNYLVVSRIPATMPLPPSTLPHALTASCQERELQALGWKPLEVAPWLQFVVGLGAARGAALDVTRSLEFATQVLTVVSKNWDNLGNEAKTQATVLLSSCTVMPTRAGLRLPSEAFFPTVKLFDDLPVVQVPLKERMLVALGVRKTLDLETIFQRLLRPNESGHRPWSHVELVKYLASVRADIPPDDLKRLRQSNLCPVEVEGGEHASLGKGPTTLYKVSELYRPSDELRALQLPLLQWPGRHLRSGGDEARFLLSLGLQECPSVDWLVRAMASDDAVRRQRARRYFVVTHAANRYDRTPLGDTQFAIVPIQGSNRLVPPSGCFTDPSSSVMGFAVMAPELRDYAAMFGVRHRPPMDECVSRLLADPPRDEASAVIVFEYFASRLGDVNQAALSRLGKADFIPVFKTGRPGAVLVSPKHCYLGTSTEYDGIFDFVTFSPDANTFLFKCGVRTEPTKPELAEMVCSEPARLLGVLQPERYLELLKTLAEPKNLKTLKEDRTLWKKMKAAPLCLAFKELPAETEKMGALSGPGDEYDDGEDDAPPAIKQAQLAPAHEVVIKDDVISYGIFKDSLVCAPEDEAIEAFYQSLGAPTLSSLVKEEVAIGPVVTRPEFVARFRKLVVERSKIFLHQYAKHEAEIKNDAKWLEKSLRIEQVRTLSLRRTFRGTMHRAQRSAASHMTRRHDAILYVSGERKVDNFEVGQALCRLLLARPTLQAYTTFEPILTLNLYDLRSRGYDVDRILRAKQEQARMAEAERRRVEEEERRRVEEEERWRVEEGKMRAQAVDGAGEVAVAAARDGGAGVVRGGTGGGDARGDTKRDTTKHDKEDHMPQMPGAFDSPPRERGHGQGQDQPARPPGDFFSNWGKRLNDWMDANGQSARDTDTRHATNTPNTTGSATPTGRVATPADVQRNLLSAVSSSRSFGPNSVSSQPRVANVQEQSTYCDASPGHSLVHAVDAANGMRFFFAQAVAPSARAALLASHTPALDAFAALLADVAGVYGLSRATLHVYYDEAGPSIAFNLGGSIFCNLRYYIELHWAGGGRERDRPATGVWWWTTLAHELAHNLCQEHSATHSYYTESFVQQYFGKMEALAARWRGEGALEGVEGALGALERVRGPPPPYGAG